MSQNWYHCLDLDGLVAKYEHYLHGNLYKQRKVVLDAKILAQSKSSQHPLQYIKPKNLKLKIKNVIMAECKAAKIAKENVLILMLGHGDRDNHGIHLGTGCGATLKISEFKRAAKAYKVNITMITTSCYSGGWTCNPQLDDKLSTMTAVGRENVNLSRRYSGSTGRACGSMFTTALVQKLTRVGGTNKTLANEDEDEDVDDDPTEEQTESYAEFTLTVHEHLLKDVDRRGYEHQFTFGTQDDAWAMCWGERTGIPLGRFKERWDSLADWEKDATLHPSDPLNRDPAITDEQLAEYLQLRADAKPRGKEIASRSELGQSEPMGSVLGKRKTSGLYGGTDRGLISMVSEIGTEYLNSYQGFDESGDDGGLHNRLRMIQSGKITNMDSIEATYRALDYRMTQMSTADKYLEMLNIPAPNEQLCCEYDIKKIRTEVGDQKHTAISRLIFDRRVLFPRPVEGQGRPFYKGMDYMIAAFHHAETPNTVVIKKLDDLAATLDRDLEQEKETMKRDPEVTSKRRKLFQSFGIAVGNISPSKRRSIGLS